MHIYHISKNILRKTECWALQSMKSVSQDVYEKTEGQTDKQTNKQTN